MIRASVPEQPLALARVSEPEPVLALVRALKPERRRVLGLILTQALARVPEPVRASAQQRDSRAEPIRERVQV